MVDQTKIPFLIIGFLLIFPHSTLQQTKKLISNSEKLALIQLRSSLGLRTRDWPIKADPCLFWRGVGCQNGRIIGINISGLKRTRSGAKNPKISVDSLSNFTLLTSFNASKFYLPGPISDWFGTRIKALQVLDLRSCSLTGSIPSSIGDLKNLAFLYLSNNRLSGSVPVSLGQLSSLSILDLSTNSLTGSIPSAFASLGNLTSLDLSSNLFSGTILSIIGTLLKLQYLNLSGNGLSSSIPPQLGDLSNLVDLDLSRNSLFGSVPADLRGLRNLQKLVVSKNSLSGLFPSDLFSIMNRLRFIELAENNFSGDLPKVLWSMPELLFLNASRNNFSGQLPNLTLSMNLTTAILDISDNMLYGDLTMVLTRFGFVNVSGNYFEGNISDYKFTNLSLEGNCLRNSSSQRSGVDCTMFYDSRGLIFDNFGLPNATRLLKNGNKNSSKKWFIVGGVVGGVVFIAVMVLVVACITVCARKRGATTTQRKTGVGPVSPSPPRGGFSLDLSSLGEALTYQQILIATDNFKDANFIKKGHSGDLFRGILEGEVHVVIKKVDFPKAKKELDFFSKVSNARLVPLLGHCLENENEKFLVYKYISNGDLLSSLYRKTDSTDDSLQSLDWITRLKIAIGAAEGLSYLHHECNPPIVHRDVQASSILLDDRYEVRLGSLSEICAHEGDVHQSRITRLLRLPTTSDQGSSGSTTTSCAYDVYCFGKVLLELVTGKLGISSSNEANTKNWLESTLPYVSIYDKELIQNIIDPSLIIDEDLLEEVWAMAIVARSCLNPRPTKRPLMRYILKALENPLKVVREENSGSRNASSRGSWNGTLFSSWRQSSSDVVAVSGPPANKIDSFKRLCTSDSQGSGRNGAGERESSMRRQSREVFPEPSDEDREERENYL